MTHIRTLLASLSHEIWSSWMGWMFTQGTFNSDGSWTMPADKAQRWQRQIGTRYLELSEGEQVSDLEQADKILTVLKHSAFWLDNGVRIYDYNRYGILALNSIDGNPLDVETLRQMANQQKRFTVMLFEEETES